MTSLAKKDFLDDPLDNVELAASIQNWTFDRSDNEVSINIPKKSNEISKKELKQNIDNELFEELKNDLNNNSNENIFSNTLRISQDDSNIFNI